MPQQEKDESIDVSQYLQTLMHRKWWFISALVAGWAIVAGISWILPPKYVSEAVVLVERQQVNPDLVKPNVQTTLQQRLDAMTQRVLSRSRLKTLIEKDNLYPKQRKSMGIDDVIDLMRKDVAIELVAPEKARPEELTGFKVSYTGATPSLAQQVTGELVAFFIDENLQITTENSSEATQFFDSQLQEASKELADQEQKLRDYKSHYLGELPEQLQSNLQILTGLQNQAQAATDALGRAQQQETYLQSLLAQYHTGPTGVVTDANVPASIDQRLTSMKAELADLRAKYTDKHPDVIRLQEDIVATEALKKKMESDPKGAGAGSPEDAKGLASLAQIRSQLKANEIEMANRKRDIKAIQAQILMYQGRLNETPVREQQLAGIVRGHEQALANYNSLLARKEQSELASNLVSRQQGEQFRIIDPPSLPQKPQFPDHFKFSLGGIAAGLALGLGLVFVKELANQSVYTDGQASTLVNAPVLTSVPRLWTASEQSRHTRNALLQNIAAVVLIAVIPIGTVFAFLHN